MAYADSTIVGGGIIDNVWSYTSANGGTLTAGTAAYPVRVVVINGQLQLTQTVANEAQIVASGGSLTGSNASTFWSYAGTWNTSGVPTALKVAITNTASNAASLLMNLLAGAGGATSQFSVSVSGGVTAAGSILAVGALQAGASQRIRWTGTSVFLETANGKINLMTNAETAGVCFNVTTDAVLQLRTRADAAFATLDCLGLKASGAAGASGTGTVISAITVVNGIVTAITVA